MLISYNWLKEFINTKLSPKEIGEALTSIGLEVEGIDSFESVKGSLNGLSVGKVLDCFKHPKSEKLKMMGLSAYAEFVSDDKSVLDTFQ